MILPMVRFSLPSARIKLHVIYNFMIRPAHGTFRSFARPILVSPLPVRRRYFLIIIIPIVIIVCCLFQFQKNARGKKKTDERRISKSDFCSAKLLFRAF